MKPTAPIDLIDRCQLGVIAELLAVTRDDYAPSKRFNIEPLARAICKQSPATHRQRSRRVVSFASIGSGDCVAAEMEAGLIDDDGKAIAHDLDQGLAAYRDWRQRHADYKPPPPRRAR